VSESNLSPESIAWVIAHIQEQCDKRHYWNAIAWTHELLGRLIKLFTQVLREHSQRVVLREEPDAR